MVKIKPHKWVVISIDPGFGGTGLCMFINKKLYRYTNIKTKAAGIDRFQDIAVQCGSTVLEWLDYAVSASKNIYDAHISRIDVAIESPHAFGGAVGAAALGRGDVFSVAKLVGALTAVLHLRLTSFVDQQDTLEYVNAQHLGTVKFTIHHPEVRVWKGQASKETTERRVLRDIEYAKEYIPGTLSVYKLFHGLPDHIFDAAGLGLWVVKNLECVL